MEREGKRRTEKSREGQEEKKKPIVDLLTTSVITNNKGRKENTLNEVNCSKSSSIGLFKRSEILFPNSLIVLWV